MFDQANGGQLGINDIEGEHDSEKKIIESENVCTINNLDTGKEFVVKKVREDGMCNKLKEVGTGRNLTMEEFDMCIGHSPIVQELMRRQNVEDQFNCSNKDDGECNLTGEGGSKSKKNVSWFKRIKNVASSVTGYKERRSSDDRYTSSEKGGLVLPLMIVKIPPFIGQREFGLDIMVNQSRILQHCIIARKFRLIMVPLDY